MTIRLIESGNPHELTHVAFFIASTVAGAKGDVHYLEVVRYAEPDLCLRQMPQLFFPDHGRFTVEEN